jgi:hypothetical protein
MNPHDCTYLPSVYLHISLYHQATAKPEFWKNPPDVIKYTPMQAWPRPKLIKFRIPQSYHYSKPDHMPKPPVTEQDAIEREQAFEAASQKYLQELRKRNDPQRMIE